MKAALTLFAQDAASKLILYSAADIRRSESDDQVLAFLAFWKKIRRRSTHLDLRLPFYLLPQALPAQRPGGQVHHLAAPWRQDALQNREAHPLAAHSHPP